jgi:endonuclease/exonuclease/phosphatase family metal-dependent hydrolase
LVSLASSARVKDVRRRCARRYVAEVTPLRRFPLRRSFRAILAVALVAAAACRTGRNYPADQAPRSAGTVARATLPSPATLRVVTFNIAYAKRVDLAIALLQRKEALRDADIVLLQEMDAEGTRRIADALGLDWVYHAAIHHRRTGRDFGNAVLSRWPIVADARLVLPHPSRYAGTQRTATAATIVVGADTVRVYATHLGTLADVSGSDRRAQLAAILADAAPWARVIVGGDLNDHDVGRVAVAAGYAWPTNGGPQTTYFGRWDHVFFRGFLPSDGVASGTIRDVGDASDHRPVWVVARLR